MQKELLAIIEGFTGRRVLLIGDFMLDRYVVGEVERVSPEAPVPVLRVVNEEDRVGGAGSVALTLLALGAQVSCCGAVGNDECAQRVIQQLHEAGAHTEGLALAADRPTTTKTRFVGLADHRHRQQILRVDKECSNALTGGDEARILRLAAQMMDDCEVVCLQDYSKGVLSTNICGTIIRRAREQGIPVCLDPGRLADWCKYAGATLVKPNRTELERAVRRSLGNDELDAAAHELIERHDLQYLFVTLGRDGALLVNRGKYGKLFPTTPRAVYDNTGAGDAVLAMLTAATAARAPLELAAHLANLAGGLEVGKFGCQPITRDEIIQELGRAERSSRGKLRSISELTNELEARRRHAETVVFTNGCFDVLHPGHVELLAKARSKGTILVVAINSDRSVRELKGPERPIRNQNDRARVLSALECVDYIVIFDEQTPERLIEQIAPDVLVKGADWRGNVVGQEFVESHGGRVALIELVEGYSTTDELERIRGARRG